MNWQVALRLGRVSNLPTVWSNSLAGLVLAGGTAATIGIELGLGLMIIMSLFYIGGMYLNDAFDQHIDAIERPERPIPSGHVRASTVYICGSSMLLVMLAGK